MPKLNVGCGPHHLRSGWLNMDIRPFKGVDVVRDATQPFGDLGPFSQIYSEHFLEHLPLGGAIKFLRNCLEALELGGQMRLATPGLEFVFLTHFDPFQASDQKMIKSTFATNRAFHGWGHQFLWTKALLLEAFRATGFSDIEFKKYGESNIEAFKGIEQHPGFRFQSGIPNYWVVEGSKKQANPVFDGQFEELARSEFIRYVDSGH